MVGGSERIGRSAAFAEIFDVTGESGQPEGAHVVTVAVVAGTYFGALFLYHLRDLLMLVLVGAFLALILNPLVVTLQHWGLRRRGLAGDVERVRSPRTGRLTSRRTA